MDGIAEIWTLWIIIKLIVQYFPTATFLCKINLCTMISAVQLVYHLITDNNDYPLNAGGPMSLNHADHKRSKQKKKVKKWMLLYIPVWFGVFSAVIYNLYVNTLWFSIIAHTFDIISGRCQINVFVLYILKLEKI